MSKTETKDLVAVQDLAKYQPGLPGPEWLRALRALALERFNATGWPTMQEEEWRRTNLSPFEFEAYSLPAVPDAALPAAVPAVDEWAGRLVYEDGALVGSSLRPDLAEAGVVFGDLAAAVEADSPAASAIRAAMEGAHAAADNRLEHWHFAMLASAAVLYVPANVAVAEPFEIDVTYGGDEVVHAPHLVAILERGADASVVRRISSSEEGEILVVDGSELVVGDGARLRVACLQRMNDESVVFSNDRGRLGRDAHLHRTEAALGADFVKARYISELAGAGADAVLNGLYFTTGEQHVDLRTVQQHRAANTTSRAFYRGAVADESHAIYQGLIQVDAVGRGTDAYLTNKNLILGDEARADSIPSLNINTDDVRCSHGSTTGRLDRDQVFYLRSRGYPKAEAVRILVEGYFEDLIEQTAGPVRDELRELIMARVSQED